MLFKSEVLTQASGSIGGVTYSHNKAGMYRRARSIPVNPNTGFQEQVRSALTEAVNFWTTQLTDTNRATWNLYAANTPVLGVLGDAIQLSGQNMLIRSYTSNAQMVAKLGVGRIPSTFLNAPSIFNLGDFTTPSFTPDVSTGISVVFTTTDDWVTTDGAFMHIFESRPQNPSVNYYNGPWRLINAIAGDAGTPPVSPFVTSPFNINLRGYPFAAEQRIWLRVRVSRPDNRLTSDRIIGPVLAIA